jgi:acetone monooxygenase
VTAAGYDEPGKFWSITTDEGETFRVQFLIGCSGMLSAPLASLFPGQDEVTG